jgi:hypothetical protein
MKRLAPVLIFGAIALAAGCAGGMTSIPSQSTQSAPASRPVSQSNLYVASSRGGCGFHHQCAQAIVPLSFNGTAFSVATSYSCRHVLENTPVYKAPASGPLTLAGNVTLPPACVPSNVPTSQLYIVGVQRGHQNGGAFTVTPIAGPASWSDNPWSFAPVIPGLTLQANTKYVFLVVAVALPPSPTPSPAPTQSPSGNYYLLGAMSYNGTAFSVVATNHCRYRTNPGQAPPYVAPTSGPLALAGPVVVTPTCVPSPLPSGLPSPLPQLYIVGIHVPQHGGHGVALQPNGDRNGGFPAIEIAGPTTIASNPWSFGPAYPGLTMQGGQSYVFFIAIPYPTPPPTPTPSPTPAPTQSPSGNYYLLGAVSYNGSTFSVVPTNHCNYHANPFQAPPYVAPTSGPLTLSGAVQVAPTCVPSPLPSGLPSPLPQLYIVGMQVPSNDRHKIVATPHGLRFAWPAVAIAGPSQATSNPWSFAPDSPGLTLQSGQSYVFFVAFQVPSPPPTPSPPQAYRPVVPLDFDGTNFTAASTGSCNRFTPPSPYPAPSTGPLVLSGAVTVTPTCAPSGSSSSLYIVATLGGWTGSATRPAFGGRGPVLFGVAIAGPSATSSNPWSFTPYPTPLTLVQNVNYLFYVAQPVAPPGRHQRR